MDAKHGTFSPDLLMEFLYGRGGEKLLIAIPVLSRGQAALHDMWAMLA
jgi:hypothetical protein